MVTYAAGTLPTKPSPSPWMFHLGEVRSPKERPKTRILQGRCKNNEKEKMKNKRGPGRTLLKVSGVFSRGIPLLTTEKLTRTEPHHKKTVAASSPVSRDFLANAILEYTQHPGSKHLFKIQVTEENKEIVQISDASRYRDIQTFILTAIKVSLYSVDSSSL